jgi:hypothetical protein
MHKKSFKDGKDFSGNENCTSTQKSIHEHEMHKAVKAFISPPSPGGHKAGKHDKTNRIMQHSCAKMNPLRA